MSGPKVINIEARRRQLQRQCEMGLHELEDVIIDWRALLGHSGKLSSIADEEAKAVLKGLWALRDAGEWETLSQQLQRRTAFYQSQENAARREVLDKTKSIGEMWKSQQQLSNGNGKTLVRHRPAIFPL